MEYQTYSASESLSDFIKCFWTLEMPAQAQPEKQRIVPDGCMEMIFHQGDLYRQWLDDGTNIIQPKSFVFGQIKTSLEIEPTGKTSIFAVRFHPGGFLPFATMRITEMENRAVSLHELFGEQGIQLESSILNASSVEQKMSIIEIFLSDNLKQPGTADKLAASCVETLLLLKGLATVDELADKLSINRRQLERKLVTAIGLSPKQLSKIIRLQTALELINSRQFTSLTSLAYETGYFDQAHFIKDFKEFTGVSPGKFYDGNLEMTTIFLATE